MSVIHVTASRASQLPKHLVRKMPIEQAAAELERRATRQRGNRSVKPGVLARMFQATGLGALVTGS